MSTERPFVPNPDPSTIVVPGVDPNLPANVQIEMIDQLITARLAGIDNNLATCHQIITNEILPQIQAFAKATQPVRDAARFWRSFFEMAATVRVPTEDDYTTTETDAETEEDQASANETITTESQEEPVTARLHDNPFLGGPGQGGHSFMGAVSSTPMRQPGDVSSVSTEGPSWSPSHGSLDVQGTTAPFSMDDSVQSIQPPQQQPIRSQQQQPQRTIAAQYPFLMDISTSSDASSAFHPPTISDTTQSSAADDIPADLFKVPQLPRQDKGKAKDLRQHVLKKAATPKLSRYNPFHPADQSSASDSDSAPPQPRNRWNGLVDLSTSSTSLSSGNINLPNLADFNFSSSSESAAASGADPVKSVGLGGPSRGKPAALADFSASSIQFPPPSQALLRVVATPSKRVGGLLVQDLLAGLGLEDSPDAGTPMSPAAERRRAFTTGPRPSILRAVQSGLLRDDDVDHGGDSFDDDDDSYEQDGPEESVYALPLGRGHEEVDEGGVGDDSYESEMSSFDGGGGGGGGRQSVPGGDMGDTTDFGGGGGGIDEDTLFGPRGNPPPPRHGFQLDHDTMSTYHGGGRLEDAMPSQQSPTPFAGNYAPLGRK